MSILTNEVEVKLNSYNVKYYEDLGYNIPMRKASEIYRKKKKKDFVYDFSKTIIVKIEDLQSGSHSKVEVLCDYCNEETMVMTYNDYMRRTKDINKIACRNCFTQKAKESNLLRYGVENYAQTKECREKMERTMERLYGVKYALQSEHFQNSFKNTCKQRYGDDYGKLFAEKAFESCYENTGYYYPSQSPQMKEKTINTLMKHYGVDSPAKSPKVREKMAKTLYLNSSQKASTQQRYICNLYQGILNYPIKHYNVDTYLPEDNLTIEYDGGFHLGNVITGRETEEEHNRKEIIRDKTIKHEGYSQMRIISSKDLLPSDQILLQMLSDARQYFSDYPNHSWIEFNIDYSIVRNAEYKNSIPYDFGELRRISKTTNVA